MAERVFVPYVPPDRSVAEITLKGVLLGLVLSVILGAANMYLGLRVGLTVSASVPAAVISMALLRMFRRHSILENNAVQTAASAGESLAAGVLFTMPALLILGYWSDVGYLETTLIALAGGILGVLFTVPLRKALIVEAELTFPEGVATSEVLKTGERPEQPQADTAAGHRGKDRAAAGGPPPIDAKASKTTGAARTAAGTGIGALLVGGLSGLVYKFMETGLSMWRATADFGFRVGRQGLGAFGMDLAPALLGVGFIVGLRIAALVFLGGVLGWVVGMPIYTALADDTSLSVGGEDVDWFEALVDGGAADAAGVVWSGGIRYIGVGAMLVGGLWTLIKLRGPLSQALRGGLGAQAEDTKDVPRTEQDFGARATLLGTLGMVVPIVLLYWYITRDLGAWQSLYIAALMGMLMVVTGFLFSAVGAYMAGLVGSSNNPISGVTILTVLAAAFMLRLLGVDTTLGPAATIMVAAVIACAGAIASDNMQDLKTGQLLGATPRKQRVMQIIGVTAAALVMAPVLQLLHDSYVIGSTDLPAPQAGLMAAVADFVFTGGLPMLFIGLGAALALVLIITDEALARTGASFRTPVMPVAVGIYLPVGLSSPIFLGGLIAWLAARWMRRAPAERREVGLRHGVLFSSGAIAGEALIGIAIAPLVVAGLQDDIAVSNGAVVWPGLLLFAYLGVLLFYVSIRPALRRAA